MRLLVLIALFACSPEPTYVETVNCWSGGTLIFHGVGRVTRIGGGYGFMVEVRDGTVFETDADCVLIRQPIVAHQPNQRHTVVGRR